MNNKVKRYELNDNMTIDMLETNNFRQCGYIQNMIVTKYCYEEFLSFNVYLRIEINIKDNGELYFDDYSSVYVNDINFEQPYYPFYSNDEEFDVLNGIIEKYNQIMDNFVKKGILKEKDVLTKKLER